MTRVASGRPAALRLRGPGTELTVDDDLLGPVTALVDDVVLRRNDGVPAYNLAVVVDDAAQGIEQVVRADDLASSAPRQRHLAGLLGLPPVRYAHVPLVLGPSGDRLAKRDGRRDAGRPAGGRPLPGGGLRRARRAPSAVLTGAGPAIPADLVAGFDPARLPSGPWPLAASDLAPS